MSRFLGVAFVVGAALALSACGFRPLYATGTTPDGMETYFSQVFVEPIPGRQGVHLRNQMMDALTPQGTPSSAAYKLSIKLEDVKEGLAIQSNTQITRYNYRLTAQYELRDTVSGEVLDKGLARAIAAYNVADSQFATQSAERDAQERAAREVGEDIRLRLGLYFEQRFGGKS
ncbi:MAG: LPS assembly lipoprotein LptE [Micropepsaceae bacterium]